MPIKRSLFTGVFILSASSFISRILGIVRNNRFADMFGASSTTDAYYAAFQIPDLIYSLIIYGAVSAAFVPIFSNYLQKKDNKSAWAFINTALSLLMITTIITASIIFMFAPHILKLVYPGFQNKTLNTAVSLTRIMLFSPIFFGVSSVLSSIQNSFHNFFFYSLAPILYNLSIIFGIVFLGPRFGIQGVAYGVVIGAFLHMIIQIPITIKFGWRYKITLNLKRKDLREAITLAVPRVFGISVMQINLLIEGFIASMTAASSLTVFRYAQDLQSFPLGIIGISFAISSFGVMSKISASKNYEKFNKYLIKKIRSILYLIIPASIGLFVLREEVVKIIFEYGQFTHDKTILTANILGVLCVSLFAASLIPIFSRAFYSLHNTRTPVTIGIATVIINLALGVILAKHIGIIGLAVANAVSAVINFTLLLMFLRKNLKNHKLFGIAFFVIQIVFASFIMGIFVYVLKNTVATSSLIGSVVLPILIGSFIYFALTKMLPEYKDLINSFKRH